MVSRQCSFESFYLGLTNVPLVILCCSREVQNPRRFIFQTGGRQMCTFKHEAWLTEPAYDTWSVPSGDDSQWKHSIYEGNYIQGALIKISGRALENEMIIYSLSQECLSLLWVGSSQELRYFPGDIWRGSPQFSQARTFVVASEPPDFILALRLCMGNTL